MEKLPEKWFVVNPYDSSTQKIYDYFNKGCNANSYKMGTHFHYPNWNNGIGFKAGYHTSSPLSGYNEITFEEFERLVLNQSIEPQYTNRTNDCSFGLYEIY